MTLSRALTVVLVLAFASPASADIVRLANGAEIRGRVVRETDGDVWVAVPGGELRLRRAEILEIVREDEGRYLVAKGSELLRDGARAEAIALLERARSLGQPDAPALLARAYLQDAREALRDGELAEARRRFAGAASNVDAAPPPEEGTAAAARLASLLSEAHEGIAAVRRRKAAARAALAAARRATEASLPERALARFREARWLDRALEAEVRPALGQAAGRLGLARARAGRYAEAATLLAEACELSPPDRKLLAPIRDRCRVAAAAGLTLAGKEGAALALLRRALRDSPDAALLQFYTGVLYEARGFAERARRHYLRALRGRGRRAPAGDLAALRDAVETSLGELPVPVELLWQAQRLEQASAVLRQTAALPPYVVHASDRETAARVGAALRSAASGIAAWAGPEVGTIEVEVYVFASIQTLWRVSGQHFHALGITRVHRAPNGSTRRQIYTARDATGLLDAVIPHEMTHALVGNRASGVAMPLWLNEGISMLSEPERVAREATKRYLQNRARGAGLSLSEVVRLEGYPESKDDLHSFYDGAAALTRHLVRRKGRAAILAAARKTHTTAALLSALDAPPPDGVEASVRKAFDAD